MSIPKSDQEAKDLFLSIVPADPRVTTRPMFGNLAAFVNGNLFTGLFGSDIFVRLSEEARIALLAEPTARPFAPMPSRPMREYVVLPPSWQTDPELMRQWVSRSMDFTSTLPAKAPGARKRKAG